MKRKNLNEKPKRRQDPRKKVELECLPEVSNIRISSRSHCSPVVVESGVQTDNSGHLCYAKREVIIFITKKKLSI